MNIRFVPTCDKRGCENPSAFIRYRVGARGFTKSMYYCDKHKKDGDVSIVAEQEGTDKKMKTSKLGEPPFRVTTGGEWTYKGEAKTPDEIAAIANNLHLDFAVSLVDNRPLTREEIEYAVELERRISDAAARE